MENDVGIPHVFMNRAHGSPLQRRWKGSERNKLEMSHEQKAKIIFQLGVIT